MSLDDLLRKLPGYTPELSARSTAAGAIMKVFARYLQLLEQGLAEVPGRSFLAFLEMVGSELLPAEAARAPLVFGLVDGSPVDVTLPERSQVAAAPSTAAPSAPGRPPPPPAEQAVFATEQAVTLCRSKLAALYSILPGSDAFADHTARLTTGFTLFDDVELCEHAIYLGHDRLFALSGEVTLLLSFTLERGAELDLETHWEYLTDSGWLPFTSSREDDTTDGLRHDGQITLYRACGPDAIQSQIGGRTSFWVRGRTGTPLVPQELTGQQPFPVVNDIGTRIQFSKTGLAPDGAFNDGTSLDVSKPFYPFGRQPLTFSVFYLASQDVFQRKGARISIDVEMSDAGQPSKDSTQKSTLDVVWEFNDGSAWQPLQFDDSAVLDFTANKKVSFSAPASWAESTVNGAKNRWLRARIASGNYGDPLSVTLDNNRTITPVASSLHPPVIKKVTLSFTYSTDPEALDHCLSYNDFVFEDQTDAARWPDRTFKPFQLVADRQPTVYFGFDRALPAGLVSLYVAAAAPGEGDASDVASPFVWEYLSTRGWVELGVLDETIGFAQRGMIQFVGAPDAVPSEGLGGRLYRVRARLKRGERPAPRVIRGVWLNAVWASHDEAVEREPLGTSDGNPGQTFSTRRRPVHVGETLRVQEWTGRGEYWRSFVLGVPDAELGFERDPATDDVVAVWVVWHAKRHLHDSGPGDRHYVVERATGLVRFGDGQRGMVPPAGRRIEISYRSGGGVSGNVPAEAITEIRTAVPFLQQATNPVAASGGAAIESIVSVKARGPQTIRHRGRAISMLDFEWLAREASPEVARARCLSVTGPDGRAQRGWVTALIVPLSSELTPTPSVELLRRVREQLAARAPASLARRIRVAGPRYCRVSVSAEIVPLPAESAAALEARVRDALNRFLHPLVGGAQGLGWNFGETVHLSQIARVLERTEGVDFVRALQLSVDGRMALESITLDENMLIAPGDHELKLSVGME